MAKTELTRVKGERRGLTPRIGGTWWAIGWLLIVATTAFCAPPSKEYQLKAAFLFNFTKFAEWSPQSLGGPDGAIIIGVLGASPLLSELEDAVRDRKVNGRGILVKRIHNLNGTKNVHLLFVSASEDARLGELREELRGANVLTVGESENFAQSGGVITFVIDGDKVRFDINVAAADKASVKISAQLQKLARAVRK